jgi:hypothetical protein
VVAGVPGAGISAYFYMLAVLAMPFVAAYRVLRAGSLHAGRWSLVASQLSIAAGIAVGLALGAVALGMIVAAPAPSVEQAAQTVHHVGSAVSRFGVALGLGTLAAVMASVYGASLLLSLRQRRAPASDQGGRAPASR